MDQYGPRSVPIYVTHTICDSIVEVVTIDDGPNLGIHCPTCDYLVPSNELSDEDCYLVAKPQ